MNTQVLLHTNGDNLLTLLGLVLDAHVLIIGKALESWSVSFRNVLFLQQPQQNNFTNKKYDLILYHSGCASTNNELNTHLNQIYSQLDENGTFVFIAKNFFSFSNLKHLLRVSQKRLTKKVFKGYLGYLRLLSKKSFPVCRVFLSMSKLSCLEDMVAPKSSFLNIPYYAHPLLRLTYRCRCFHYFAESYIFFCSLQSFDQGGLIQSIAVHLSRKEEDYSITSSIVLERIELRHRGAMVLFLINRSNSKRYIARVVSGSRAQTIIRRNHLYLEMLKHLQDLPDRIKSLIPLPMGAFFFNGSVVFIESLMPGILAWKVNHGDLSKCIYQESTDFIMKFNQFTKMHVLLEQEHLSRLFATDLQRIKECSTVCDGLKEKTAMLVSALYNYLENREVYLSFSHGDFGYGNILVDVRSGQLTGVIDWDTGKKEELVGVDFLNLEIQKDRLENNCDFFCAFSKVVTAVTKRQGLDEKGFYQSEFGVEGPVRDAVLAATLLRYMGRAAQYPDVFLSEQNDYHKAIELMQMEVVK